MNPGQDLEPRQAPSGASEDPAAPEWARRVVRVLDDALRIPGTNIGVGLDGLLGLLFPALGDAVGAMASLSLLWLAFQMRVPKVVLARMVVNVGIDAMVGAIPLLGDVFDFAWKANRKNLDLIERHRGHPAQRPTPSDYAVVGLAVLCVILLIALPIVVSYFVLSRLGRLLFGA